MTVGTVFKLPLQFKCLIQILPSISQGSSVSWSSLAGYAPPVVDLDHTITAYIRLYLCLNKPLNTTEFTFLSLWLL
jgi:hypothetical protein